MEFRIAVDELSRALARAQGIVQKKPTIPALANVLIQARDGQVSISSYDLDIGLVTQHPADVLTDGEITLSAKHLFDIVRSLPEANVQLKRLANNAVEISSGKAAFKLYGIPADEYPSLPKEEQANMVKIEGATLSKMIAQTAFAISTDDTRYTLSGLYFESANNGKIRAVATDGHRLSMVEQTMEGGEFKLAQGVILPRKGMLELKRLIDEAPEAECYLGFGETSAIFKKPGLSMLMRLIDGRFPSYEDVIPKERDSQVKLRRAEFAAVIKRVALLADEKSHSVRFELAEDELKIASQNAILGEARESLPVSYNGPAVDVGFNARYLMDVLTALDEEEIRLEMVDDQSPGVVRPASNDSYTAVIMPMRA